MKILCFYSMLCEVFPLLFGNSGKPMDFGLGKNYHSTQQNATLPQHATLHKNKSCMYPNPYLMLVTLDQIMHSNRDFRTVDQNKSLLQPALTPVHYCFYILLNKCRIMFKSE